MMEYQPRSILIILRSHMLKAAINTVTIVTPSSYMVIGRLKSLDSNKQYGFIQNTRIFVDFVIVFLVLHITKAYF